MERVLNELCVEGGVVGGRGAALPRPPRPPSSLSPGRSASRRRPAGPRPGRTGRRRRPRGRGRRGEGACGAESGGRTLVAAPRSKPRYAPTRGVKEVMLCSWEQCAPPKTARAPRNCAHWRTLRPRGGRWAARRRFGACSGWPHLRDTILWQFDARPRPSHRARARGNRALRARHLRPRPPARPNRRPPLDSFFKAFSHSTRVGSPSLFPLPPWTCAARRPAPFPLLPPPPP
jgi:hypothetical protein